MKPRRASELPCLCQGLTKVIEKILLKETAQQSEKLAARTGTTQAQKSTSEKGPEPEPKSFYEAVDIHAFRQQCGELQQTLEASLEQKRRALVERRLLQAEKTGPVCETAAAVSGGPPGKSEKAGEILLSDMIGKTPGRGEDVFKQCPEASLGSAPLLPTNNRGFSAIKTNGAVLTVATGGPAQPFRILKSPAPLLPAAAREPLAAERPSHAPGLEMHMSL